jgi:hypothetical protein
LPEPARLPDNLARTLSVALLVGVLRRGKTRRILQRLTGTQVQVRYHRVGRIAQQRTHLAVRRPNVGQSAMLLSGKD